MPSDKEEDKEDEEDEEDKDRSKGLDGGSPSPREGPT